MVKEEIKKEETPETEVVEKEETPETEIIEEEKIEIEKTGKEAEEVVVKPIAEEEIKVEKKEVETGAWHPKTEIGKKVKIGEIKDIDEILDNGLKLLEVEVVDVLVPDIETDLLLIGQSKGKFGGGQRRVFKQTQKKTNEGNKPKFSAYAVVGNHDGIIGTGLGKAKETVPAREKAFRNAKLNIMKIRRGCGCWECGCKEPHSIPFEVEGKCGSVKIKLIPAPKGKGLVVENECQKILKLAGVNDIWSKTSGKGGTKNNLIVACMKALEKLMQVKIKPKHVNELGLIEGAIGEVKESAS